MGRDRASQRCREEVLSDGSAVPSGGAGGAGFQGSLDPGQAQV